MAYPLLLMRGGESTPSVEYENFVDDPNRVRVGGVVEVSEGTMTRRGQRTILEPEVERELHPTIKRLLDKGYVIPQIIINNPKQPCPLSHYAARRYCNCACPLHPTGDDTLPPPPPPPSALPPNSDKFSDISSDSLPSSSATCSQEAIPNTDRFSDIASVSPSQIPENDRLSDISSDMFTPSSQPKKKGGPNNTTGV